MPVIHTSDAPLESGNRPAWSEVTSASVFRIPFEGSRFDCHYHDCDEYWLIFSGKAKVMSEGRVYFEASCLPESLRSNAAAPFSKNCFCR